MSYGLKSTLKTILNVLRHLSRLRFEYDFWW